MSCWTKEELENMLEDVVNELDLSDKMIEAHGPHGTAPATLVRLVLKQKDLEIRMLKQGFKSVTPGVPRTLLRGGCGDNGCEEYEETPNVEVSGGARLHRAASA